MLVRVINGDVPLAAAEELFAPNVIIHMDWMRIDGIKYWIGWIDRLRRFGRFDGLRLIAPQVRCPSPSIVVLSAYWSGTSRTKHADAISPCLGESRYRVVDGRIREVWTHKSNYEFVLGCRITYPGYFVCFLAWTTLYLWLCQGSRQGSWPA